MNELTPRQFWGTWSGALVLWVALLAAAVPFDLPLSRAVTRPDGPLAWAVFYFGELPAWLAVAGAVALLLAKPRSELGALAEAVLLQAVTHALVITWMLKLLWGRVRYLDLAANCANYTPFFVPAGVGAGYSFPSGHVAAAMVLAPLPCFALHRGQLRMAWASAAVLFAYGLLVLWGRIVAGGHYLTDGLFSLGSGALLAPLLLRVVLSRRSRHLAGGHCPPAVTRKQVT